MKKQHPKKSLGQNFLTDQNIIDIIVNKGNINQNDTILVMPTDQVLKETEAKMAKSETAMMHEFEGVRTGKANPALVENLMVDAYGSSMRLRDMAGITAPESRIILIQPWDAGTVESISKAIQSANLGLNPAIDGKVIRITLPELSQERREELVKVAKKITEDGRVAVRHVRRDAHAAARGARLRAHPPSRLHADPLARVLREVAQPGA